MGRDEKDIEIVNGTVVMRSGLTDEELRRLNDVRKQIWKGGYSGFVIGGVIGLGNCTIFQMVRTRVSKQLPKHPVVKRLPRLQNKHFVMWTLVSGALGTFLGAVVEGTRASESLRDIYERRADEAKGDGKTIVVRTRHTPNDPEYHVAKASADSHERRRVMIETKKREEQSGISRGQEADFKDERFKPR